MDMLVLPLSFCGPIVEIQLLALLNCCRSLSASIAFILPPFKRYGGGGELSRIPSQVSTPPSIFPIASFFPLSSLLLQSFSLLTFFSPFSNISPFFPATVFNQTLHEMRHDMCKVNTVFSTGFMLFILCGKS